MDDRQSISANRFILVQMDELGEFLRELLSREMEEQIGPLKSVIAIKQKDACNAVGITDDTARNRVANGKVQMLQRDGSRLVYFELREVPGLMPRSGLKRKRS